MAQRTDRAASFGQNLYLDTRGAAGKPVPFTAAVVNGLAAGGGLYVPQELPTMTVEEIAALASLPYAERAATVYKAFNIDLPDSTIDELMSRAYGENFDDAAVCPITSLDKSTHILELWHGPTSAFKDMALQCLPHFFSASASALREAGKLDHDFMILVATSGDTGKAALEGFKGVDGTTIGVLFPDGGVSDIQRKQMVTTTGDNVRVWAVRGNFDDCQTGVKRTFSDDAFAKQLLTEDAVALSSANSINWGRLLPQVVYYISSYAKLVASGKIEAGDEIDVCVPTGNFGNILAAWYAKQIGTPIGMLLCASNDNRVLTDFINTGTYDISDRAFILTASPSMDILISSNLERLLFALTGDTAEVRGYMDQLAEPGRYQVSGRVKDKLQKCFKGYFCDDRETQRVIRSMYDKHGYLIDTHTAVAFSALEQYRQETGDDTPAVVASTASPFKFCASVLEALGETAPAHGLDALDQLSAKTGLPAPAPLAGLRDKQVRFTQVVEKDRMVDAVRSLLG